MRTIDADALKSALWEDWGYNSLVAEICEFVDKQPTIQSDEPRVMTLEEALSADECWIEGRNGACGYGDALLTDDAERVEFFRPHTISTLDFYAYGKDWRCWSMRPGDKERKTKWQD